MAEKNWTIPEMRTALVLLRSLLPEHEIERIIDEVRCEGWSFLAGQDPKRLVGGLKWN